MTDRPVPPEIKIKAFRVWFIVNYADGEKLLEAMKAALPRIWEILGEVQIEAGGPAPNDFDIDAIAGALRAEVDAADPIPRREERNPPRGAAEMLNDEAEGGDHDGGD